MKNSLDVNTITHNKAYKSIKDMNRKVDTFEFAMEFYIHNISIVSLDLTSEAIKDAIEDINL